MNVTLGVENLINSFVHDSCVHCSINVVPNNCLMSNVKCFHIEIEYNCRSCDNCFSRLVELGGHLQIKHGGSEPPCTICARKAETNWLFKSSHSFI